MGLIICKIFFLCIGITGVLLTIKTAQNLAYFLSFEQLTRSGAQGLLHDDPFSCDKPFFFPLLWNTSLLALFIFQHSFMAGKWWNDTLKSFGCDMIGRLLYIITTCLVLNVVMNNYTVWPTPTVWRVGSTWLFFLIHTILWAIIFLSALGMEFFEFVGLEQLVNYFWQQEVQIPAGNVEKQKARDHMRHSGILCFVSILWVHPFMTAERLLVSIVFTLYVLFGHRVTAADYKYVKNCKV